jgi:hypothetical protein
MTKSVFKGQVAPVIDAAQEAAPTDPPTVVSPAPHATHAGGVAAMSMYQPDTHAQASMPRMEYTAGYGVAEPAGQAAHVFDIDTYCPVAQSEHVPVPGSTMAIVLPSVSVGVRWQ